MSRPTKLSIMVILAASVALGACSTPDPSPPAKFSGDPSAAIPTVSTTTTTVAPAAPPSTRFYSQGGVSPTTTSVESSTTTAA